MSDEVPVVVATPLPAGLRAIIAGVDPRVRLLVDDDLLPPQLFPGDHQGDPGFRRTDAQHVAFRDLLSRAEILYGIPDLDTALLAATVRRNPGLRWVQTMAAGGGGQLRDAGLTREELARVVVTTSAGVHGGPLAEFAVFGVFAGAKDLPRLQRLQRARDWAPRWTMQQVREQTVLVVGLGGIGLEVARLLSGVGARVTGVKRTPEPAPHVERVDGVERLGEAVADADAIVLTLPGTDATRGLFDADIFARCRPGVVLVNVGRGSVVDESALIDALETGRVGAAYLDVFAEEPLPAGSPLWAMDQVVISPHTAALNDGEDRRIAELFADNLRRYLDGAPLRNVVDTEHFY